MNPSHSKILLRNNKLIRIITIFFATGCISAGVNYVVKPVFVTAVNYFFIDGQLQIELPFKAKHFIDDKSIPAFLLTYFVHTCFAYFVVSVTVS